MVFEALTTLAPFASLPLRILIGMAFIDHGYPKVIGPGRKQTRDWLKSIGIPGVLGPLAGLLELLGGISLLIGFLIPLVGILLSLEMIGTTILSKKKMGKKYLLGYELDLAYLAGALALIVLGGGPFSLDAILGL